MLVSGRVTPKTARRHDVFYIRPDVSRLVDGLLVEKGGGMHEELVMMVEGSWKKITRLHIGGAW